MDDATKSKASEAFWRASCPGTPPTAGHRQLDSSIRSNLIMANDMRHPGTPAPLNYRRPSTFSAACPGCGRTLLGLLAALSAGLRSVFAASQNPPHPHHGRKRAVFVFAGFLLLTGGNAYAQGSVAMDRAALVVLYNATDGPNWTDNTHWLSNEPLSEWRGVEVNDDGRVTELALDNNQLTGEIPVELAQLSQLQELSLHSNQLTGEIPVELAQLSQLLRLYLDNNQLTGEIPVELSQLSQLQELYLSDNQLTGEIPVELSQLSQLLRLYLHSNQLTGEIPVELSQLSQLRWAFLDRNQLTGEIPAELSQLSQLLWLYLDRNQLTGEIPAELSQLSQLQELYLSDNQLTGEIPAELSQLSQLRSLSLHSNQLTGEIPVELAQLSQLLRLYLDRNQLTGEIPAELSQLSQLQELNLSDNTLSGPIPPELENLAQLQVFDVRNTGLSCVMAGSELHTWLTTINSQGAVCAPVVRIRDLSVREDIGTAMVPVTLSRPTQVSLSVPWETAGLDAVSPDDYTDGRGALTFAPGASTATISIPIVDDAVQEDIESLSVVLGPGEGYSLEHTSVVVNILDNDGDDLLPSRATVDGTTLVLTYDEVLDSASTPYPFHFYVTVDDTRVDVDQVSVDESMVTLALATAVQAGQTVTLGYSGVGQNQNQIQDGEGNAAMSFTDWLVTNITGGDGGGTEPPVDGGGGGTEPPVDGGGGGADPPGGSPGQTMPDAPTNLLADATDGAVTLTWEAPEDDGGSEITDYEYRIDGEGEWISIGSTLTTHTVTGLDNGTAYVFEVRAVNRIGRGRASNRAEATPEAPEVFTLDFAHFANGTGITSDLVLVNVDPQPIRPAIYFYDTEGAPIAAESVVDVTGDLEVTENGALTVQMEMEPLGELTISTHGQGELVSGSVKVLSDGPIGGGLRYNFPAIGEAVVGASPPVGDALFPVRRQEGGINTGVAIHNLGEEAMEARCELMREGVLRDFVSISLEANGQTSWLIDQAFPAADTSDFTGSVRCTAPGSRRFTAIAVEMDAAERIFNTLSVVPVDRTGGGNKQTALDFAHFVNGTWITDLVFVNLSTEASRPAPTPFHTDILPSRPAIYFYDTEGAPVSPDSVVDITGDLEITEDGALTVRTEMEPLGVLTISTHGRGELVSGSVRVVSDGPIGGMLRFEHPAIGEAVVGAGPPVGDVLFPVRRQEGGITTGVAIHNLESSPALVRCDLMREGVLLDAVSLPLAANGQTSWLLDQSFPAADTSDFVGAVRCDAVGEGRFSAVALEMDPATRTFTTLPVVPVPERMDRE